MFTVGENIFLHFDLSVFIYNGLALYHFGKYLFCQQCCGGVFRINIGFADEKEGI
jgi:hypothetical protein